MLTRKTIIPVLMLLMICASCGTVKPPVPTPTSVPMLICDATLWHHVYHPQRLQVLDKCIKESGTVTAVRHEQDGDAHIILSLVTPLDGHKSLVTEAICVYAVTQADAVQSCTGFHNIVRIPNVGDHVTVVGTHVFDKDHGWEEIHPITSLQQS